MEQRRLLTIAEVALALGVSGRWVRQRINAGELRAVSGIGKGRGLRVPRAWLDAFILEREERPAPQLLASATVGPRCRRHEPCRAFASPAEALRELLGNGRAS